MGMSRQESGKATWRMLFEAERENRKDETPIVAVAPNQEALDVEFDDGFGSPEGAPVLIWTEAFVYFPVVYDGAEDMGSAPRNPVAEGQGHVGSW